jgi:hypothetical protein
VLAHLRRMIETGGYPHLQAALEANAAAGGDIEDLARMASDERRFDRGLQFLFDGIEVELARQAAPAAKRRRGR